MRSRCAARVSVRPRGQFWGFWRRAPTKRPVKHSRCHAPPRPAHHATRTGPPLRSGAPLGRTPAGAPRLPLLPLVPQPPVHVRGAGGMGTAGPGLGRHPRPLPGAEGTCSPDATPGRWRRSGQGEGRKGKVPTGGHSAPGSPGGCTSPERQVWGARRAAWGVGTWAVAVKAFQLPCFKCFLTECWREKDV